jgi:hypothetical protein
MNTPSLKKTLARKAVKTTAKHSVHGTASKLKRSPVRSTTLLAIGAVAGLVAGWRLARTAAQPSTASA